MPRLRAAAALAAFALAGCHPVEDGARPGPPQAGPQAAPDRHVLIAISLGPNGARVLASRIVEGPLPVDRAPADDPWAYRVEGAGGEVLFEGRMRAAGVLRGEWPGPGGKLEGVRVEIPNDVVTVRTPLDARAARLKVMAVRRSQAGEAKPGGGPEVVADVPFPEVPR